MLYCKLLKAYLLQRPYYTILTVLKYHCNDNETRVTELRNYVL